MKRTISFLIALILICTMGCVNAFAFGGYAHWNIACRAVSEYGISNTQNYADAFKTGCLLADIGYANWDDKYTKSDSADFAATMMSVSPFNEQARYFARGWQAHVYQDTEGSVSNIVNSLSYRTGCGKIDEYLRDELDISCPINGTANMYICYEIIRDTYEALNNFSPTNDEIDSEIEEMFDAYNLQIGLNFFSMSDSEISAMNTQFDELAEDCYSTSSLYTIDNKSKVITYSERMDFIKTESNKPAKKPIADSFKKQLKEYTHLEIISVDEYGGATVRYVIDNEIAYQNIIEQYCELIVMDTIYEKE